MSVTIKREIVLCSVVTDQLKKQLADELQRAAMEIEQRVAQIDQQTKGYITDLQRTDLQQAMAVRKRVEEEKEKQAQLLDAIKERQQQVEVLDNGAEIVRGTMESHVEVNVGDDLSTVLGGTEIVTKDDVVIEIRRREILSEDEAPAVMINTDITGSNDA